jgi:hypothetical protein
MNPEAAKLESYKPKSCVLPIVTPEGVSPMSNELRVDKEQ